MLASFQPNAPPPLRKPFRNTPPRDDGDGDGNNCDGVVPDHSDYSIPRCSPSFVSSARSKCFAAPSPTTAVISPHRASMASATRVTAAAAAAAAVLGAEGGGGDDGDGGGNNRGASL